MPSAASVSLRLNTPFGQIVFTLAEGTRKGHNQAKQTYCTAAGPVTMARTRTLIFAGVAIILFAAVVLVFVDFISRVHGDPSIVIENTSVYPVRKLNCTLSTNRKTWTERKDELAPGGEVEFSESTSDLYIESIEFEFQGKLRQWQEDHIATPGETLRFRIDNDGEVSVSYDPLLQN